MGVRDSCPLLVKVKETELSSKATRSLFYAPDSSSLLFCFTLCYACTGVFCGFDDMYGAFCGFSGGCVCVCVAA